jgi:hypothetical protein
VRSSNRISSDHFPGANGRGGSGEPHIRLRPNQPSVGSQYRIVCLGSSAYLLELNIRVLCGTSEQKRCEYHKHIAASNRCFYERTDAGIQDLAEWYVLHRHESVWHRAASIYIHILSEPQVFIEGNDRIGTLVMSYILVKEGQPPSVLTAENAKAYLEFSALVKKLPRNGLANLFRLPLLKARIACLLRDQSKTDYLLWIELVKENISQPSAIKRENWIQRQ